MSQLGRYVWRYAPVIGLTTVFLAIEATGDLLQPTLMAAIIDHGIAEKNLDFLVHQSLIMLLVTIVGALAAIARNLLSSTVSQRFAADLRGGLYRTIQGFSATNLDRLPSASLITRLTNDVTQVQNFLNGLMRIFVKSPLICLGAIIMASLLNPSLAIILMIIVPLVILLIALNMRVSLPIFRRVQVAVDRVNTVAREYLSGVRVVKAFGQEAFENDRFQEANQALAQSSRRGLQTLAVFSPAIGLIVNGGIIAVLWYGGYRVSQGHMQVGQIVAFVNYMTQILVSLSMMSNIFTSLVRAKASGDRIEEVLAATNDISFPQSVETWTGKAAAIEFRSLSFNYGDSPQPALDQISFDCPSGSTLGLVGSTGSGKTTVINLILRLYDPTQGEVWVHGRRLADLDPSRLRELVAVVPQKAHLFAGTIRENILWGRAAATDQDVMKVSQAAQIDQFIADLPQGYDTLIGAGGVNLSGGQKQRLCIARALIRQPTILILDDSLSAVDIQTEMKLRASLAAFNPAMTTVIVAQRLSSLAQAQQIIVLDKGRLVGNGRHTQLLADCAVYQAIYQSQTGTPRS